VAQERCSRLGADGLDGMVAVRNGSQRRGLVAGGIRRGLRGLQGARVGVQLEAGYGVAQEVGGIDKAAERRVHDQSLPVTLTAAEGVPVLRSMT
jgi:hypothetical protein